MATGRTVTKWTRFGVTCTDNVAREIAVDSISPVGFVYDETELTAYQDQVKGYLAGHPDATIDITGPFDTKALIALAGSGNPPTLSGSHLVLSPISLPTYTIPVGLWVAIGIRGWWTAATDYAFGIDTPGLAAGYHCTKYQVEGEKYSARFVPHPGCVPAWDTAILIDWA